MSAAAADGAGSTPWSEWPAPAKLNLFLHIVGRRDDGYHRLQTVFRLLDWGDRIRLRVRGNGAVRRYQSLPGVGENDDLTVRAARALQGVSGTALGVDIAVDKIIPLGGGLGGGSSDAATTLVALNALWRAGLDTDALAEIGLTLGADVSVFVRGRDAWAEGIGERLTAIELPEQWFVVVDSGAAVPTADLFRDPQLTRDVVPLTIPLFVSGASTSNVFEPLVAARFPEVASALAWLSGFGDARLTGSGGCIFAAFDSRDDATQVAAQCPSPMRAFVAAGAGRSPLLAALDAWQRDNA